MKADKSNSNKKCTSQKDLYPSAELLQHTCYEDYRRILDTYDKIYEKINIALGFSGVILLVVISNFDYTVIGQIIRCTSKLELFSLLTLTVCSLASTVLILWAVVQLLLMMRSKKLTVFDSIAIRNEKVYRKPAEVASVWLIDKYTLAINSLRPEIEKKQKAYDKALLKLIIGLMCFAVVLLIKKGL